MPVSRLWPHTKVIAADPSLATCTSFKGHSILVTLTTPEPTPIPTVQGNGACVVVWDRKGGHGGKTTEITVCPGLVIGWVMQGKWPLQPSSRTRQPTVWGTQSRGEPPSAYCHPWRVVRQTHSKLCRLWFTFRASARALAPPSPMLLLDNLQEMGHK